MSIFVRPGASPTGSPISPVRRPSAGLAEWALLLAAVLHLWEVDSHGRAWVGYGAFFVFIVVVQAVYSLLLARRWHSRGFLLLGITVNCSLIALWAWTRTVGAVPVGPHRHVEAVGVVDVTAMTLQLIAVVLLVQALRRLPGRAGR